MQQNFVGNIVLRLELRVESGDEFRNEYSLPFKGGGQIVKSSATLFRKDFNRRKEIKCFTRPVVN